jgi:Sulfotransferase domain
VSTVSNGSAGAADRLRKVAIPAFAALPGPARRAVLHALGRFAPWEDGFDFTAPEPREGEVVGPPDFVGIGAQKCGTTWWYDLIAAHPDVACRADIHKERHFFGRFATRAFGPADTVAYHSWFPRPETRIAGEWTPDYLHQPWVPPLVAKAAPDTRLLLLVRDPVERFRSGLAHHRRHTGRLTADVHADAVARGLYGRWLERWLEHVPRDRVLVLQYERCVIDPAGQLERTYAFLGLPPSTPPGLRTRVSASGELAPLEPDARRRLAEVYGADVHLLSTLAPELDLDLWPSASAAADAMTGQVR